MVSRLTKLLSCLTSDLFVRNSSVASFSNSPHPNPPPPHPSTVPSGIGVGQSPTLPNSQVRRGEILKYIKSGLSCLFAYQFRQSIVWTMETIRRCIAWTSASLLVGSGPVRRPQGFLSDYQCSIYHLAVTRIKLLNV